MEITIIGSGDAFGSGGKFNTCFYVQSTQNHFLIDCGASSLLALKKTLINPNTVDTIFISHFHGDHFGGLPFFILDAHLVQKRTSPLTIVGPIGLQSRVVEIMEALFRGSSMIDFSFQIFYHEVAEGELKIVNGIEVSYYSVVHAIESSPHGLRVRVDGKALAYSGDTEWTENLIPLASDTDLFIVECYNFKGDLKFHMNYEVLRKNQQRLASKKILLTHLGEDMIKQKNALEMEVCEDGKTVFV